MTPRFSIVFVVLLILCSGGFSVATLGASDEKIRMDELVAGHLKAIGSPEARNAAVNRIITGTATVTFRQGGRGQAEGKALLASSGPKNLIAMAFGVLDYPFEKIGFDGKRVTAGQVKPGVRTLLGRFLMTNDLPFREGVACGILSSAWPLLNASDGKARMQYDGLKRVDKRSLHAVKYGPQKDIDLRTTLFFDPETLRHVRTEYHQNIGSHVGSQKPGDSVGQDETWVDIIEEFSDFLQESDLMLPHTYKIQLTIRGQRGSVLTDWVVKLNEFKFGQSIDPKDFDVESN